MSESKSPPMKAVALIIVGAVLAFAGFVFPGWLWCTNTPGDIEMITLASALLVGALGAVLFLVGIIWFIFSKKSTTTGEGAVVPFPPGSSTKSGGGDVQPGPPAIKPESLSERDGRGGSPPKAE